MEKIRILVVDDEVHILELIKYNLEQSGFLVDVAENGEVALSMIEKGNYNLVLLDLMLPGMSGTVVCQRVRRNVKMRKLPIIMLTAKGEETDKIEGLDTGADDYITKPFSINELKARINSLLRRSGDLEPSGSMEIDGIVIDSIKHEVKVDGLPVEMTLKEYELLKLLLLNQGKVLTRDMILDRVWGYEYFGDTRTVDVHIRHLRRKIGQNKSELIETVRGVGYRLK
ncbi:MAG: response regulator transcription factor [Peptostreptococcaceae bacterium]|nr:response regulator transcription factor [Peptostreptococcaceae bacterium]